MLEPRGQGPQEGPRKEVEPLRLAKIHLRQKGRGRNTLDSLSFYPPISRLPLSKSIRKPADTGGWPMQLADDNLQQFRTAQWKGEAGI